MPCGERLEVKKVKINNILRNKLPFLGCFLLLIGVLTALYVLGINHGVLLFVGLAGVVMVFRGIVARVCKKGMEMHIALFLAVLGSMCVDNPALAELVEEENHVAPSVVEVSPEILKLQHRIMILENELKLAQMQPIQESSLTSDDFVELPREHWTHSPKGILVCIKTMKDGQCYANLAKSHQKEVKEPHPWYSPQEYLDSLDVEGIPTFLYMDHYTPMGKLYLYFNLEKP